MQHAKRNENRLNDNKYLRRKLNIKSSVFKLVKYFYYNYNYRESFCKISYIDRKKGQIENNIKIK